MSKQIVCRFDNKIEKIEFYEIIKNIKHLTLLRKQGTDDYYVYNNTTKLTSNPIELKEPISKKDYKKLLRKINIWYQGIVYFWADSRFVTDAGLPNYEQLVDIYKKLIAVKQSESDIKYSLAIMRGEGTWFSYIKLKLFSMKVLRRQTRTIKEMGKDFKIIW